MGWALKVNCSRFDSVYIFVCLWSKGFLCIGAMTWACMFFKCPALDRRNESRLSFYLNLYAEATGKEAPNVKQIKCLINKLSSHTNSSGFVKSQRASIILRWKNNDKNDKQEKKQYNKAITLSLYGIMIQLGRKKKKKKLSKQRRE